MLRYALMTEASPGIYEVFKIIREGFFSDEYINRIKEAYDSGSEISGIKVSPDNFSLVSIGATWNGTSFEGGEPVAEHINSRVSDIFAVLADNKVLTLLANQKNTIGNDLFNAAFAGPIKMIQIADDQVVSLGYTWNGVEFIRP